MSLPVFNARLRPGQLLVKNGNFENHPIISGGSRATGTWIVNNAPGSLTNDRFGWFFQNTGPGVVYYDATTSKWGGTGLVLAIPDVGGAANPSFSNWDGSNIRKYGIRIQPSTSHTGVGTYQTSYIAGTLGANIGARAFFEERDKDGVLLATHYTDFVTGNTRYDEYLVTFTTDPNAFWLTLGGQVVGINGINDLQMYSWWSGLRIIDNVQGAITRTSAAPRTTATRVDVGT